MAAESRVQVETLVFMHSKASGSSNDGENSMITEIYMQAVSRKHFLSRAMNKYENMIKLVAMPRDENEQTVSKVTAEKNKQESLDAADAELLKLFLLRLTKPVCFLAHSGKKYDFRFLKVLLNKFQGEPISDLFYADTFEGFKVVVPENLETSMANLSLESSSQDSNTNPTGTFKLHCIYQQIIGNPTFHINFTESNVKMMYEIALKYAKTFMDWVDKNAYK